MLADIKDSSNFIRNYKVVFNLKVLKGCFFILYMDYNDTNAEEWKRYMQLQEELARRDPAQFKRYMENMREAKKRICGENNREEGDGWLRIRWRD